MLHSVQNTPFFSILYLTSTEMIFTIYNFIHIVLITFAIETNLASASPVKKGLTEPWQNSRF